MKNMAKRLVKISEITRSEWLEQRRKGIGGSDSATVVGLNPYGSLYELWADKLGFLPDKEDTEAMRTGRDLEQYVAERFCEATGKKVRRLPYMYCHDEYPFIFANIDRKVVGENAALECKTTGLYNKTDFENGEVQANYLCQCYHYMNVMGYDRMYLAVLILSKGFFWYTIERNEAEQQALLEAEVNFWKEYIEGDSVPAPDGSESAERALKSVYGFDAGDSVSLVHADGLLGDYAKAAEDFKLSEKRKKELEQQLKMCLGEAPAGIGSEYRCSWKTQSRSSIDSKLLKERYPNAYNECLRTTQSRVFRFAEAKKDLSERI